MASIPANPPKDLNNVFGVVSEAKPFVIGDATFYLKNFDPSSIEAQIAANRLAKPIKRLIDNKLLTPQQELSLSIKLFIECSLTNWENVYWLGEYRNYDKDTAFAMLEALPKLYKRLVSLASDDALFAIEEDETVKN